MTTPDNGQHFATRNRAAKKNLSFFREAGRGKALVQINNVVKFHPGIIALMGEEGSGRSRVLKQFADGLKNKPGSLCMLDRAVKNESQLYAAIADGFEMDLVPGENLTTIQKAVSTFLETNTAKNKPVIIVLDNTHQCSLAVLEALIVLHAKFKTMSLILVGDSGLQKMLQRLQGGKLTVSPVLLAPLDAREAHQYMNWRLPFQISDSELANITRNCKGNIGLLEQEALKAETNHRQKNTRQFDSGVLHTVAISRGTMTALLAIIIVAGGASAAYYFYRDSTSTAREIIAKAQPFFTDWLALIPGISKTPIETIQVSTSAQTVPAFFRSNQEWVEQQVTLLMGDVSQSM